MKNYAILLLSLSNIALIASDVLIPVPSEFKKSAEIELTKSMSELTLFSTRSFASFKLTQKEQIWFSISLLIRSNEYLTKNEEPRSPPLKNIAPPNGGRSGVSPDTITDPKEREAYIASIEANNKLREQHQNWQSALRLKNESMKSVIDQYLANPSILFEPDILEDFSKLPLELQDSVLSRISSREFHVYVKKIKTKSDVNSFGNLVSVISSKNSLPEGANLQIAVSVLIAIERNLKQLSLGNTVSISSENSGDSEFNKEKAVAELKLSLINYLSVISNSDDEKLVYLRKVVKNNTSDIREFESFWKLIKIDNQNR